MLRGTLHWKLPNGRQLHFGYRLAIEIIEQRYKEGITYTTIQCPFFSFRQACLCRHCISLFLF